MLLLPLLLAILPPERVVVDRCDVVEINHVHDKIQANHQCTKLLFWRGDVLCFSQTVAMPATARGRFLAMGDGRRPSALPVREGGDWVCRFLDEDAGLTREVRCVSRVETWTVYDVALDAWKRQTAAGVYAPLAKFPLPERPAPQIAPERLPVRILPFRLPRSKQGFEPPPLPPTIRYK